MPKRGLFLIVLEIVLMAQFIPTAEGSPALPEVRDLNGAPALFIDGKPFFPTMIMAPWHLFETTEQGQRKLRAEADAGFELHSTCDELTLRDFEKMWTGPSQYDFTLAHSCPVRS